MARIPNEDVKKAVEKCLQKNFTATKKSVSKCVSNELKKKYNKNVSVKMYTENYKNMFEGN